MGIQHLAWGKQTQVIHWSHGDSWMYFKFISAKVIASTNQIEHTSFERIK